MATLQLSAIIAPSEQGFETQLTENTFKALGLF